MDLGIRLHLLKAIREQTIMYHRLLSFILCYFGAVTAFQPIITLWILIRPRFVENHKRTINYFGQICSRLFFLVFLTDFYLLRVNERCRGCAVVAFMNTSALGKSHNRTVWNLIYAGVTRRKKVANFNPLGEKKIKKIEDPKFYLCAHKR